MRPRYLIGMFFTFGLGLYLGGMIEHRTHTNPAYRKIHILSKQVERFENPYVFHHAEKVSTITGAPLYQVLTGKSDN